MCIPASVSLAQMGTPHTCTCGSTDSCSCWLSTSSMTATIRSPLQAPSLISSNLTQLQSNPYSAWAVPYTPGMNTPNPPAYPNYQYYGGWQYTGTSATHNPAQSFAPGSIWWDSVYYYIHQSPTWKYYLCHCQHTSHCLYDW